MRELEFIHDILRELSPYVARQHADRAARSVQTKSHAADLLTETDLEVQRRVHAAVQRAFPGDAFMAEEAGLTEPPTDRAARCWILDPVDGTHNFVKGVVPTFGITLAFVQDAQPVAGGVIFPKFDDLFLAQRGGGATRNGRPIHVSSVTDLPGAKIECDFGRPPMRPASTRLYQPILLRAGQIRSHGCAVASLCDVAAGEAEAYLHVGLQPWDFAAGVLLITEAGGTVTKLNGDPLDIFEGGGGILCANPALHRTLLQAMASAG